MLRPVKSWIGEISANSSLSPSRRNQSKESRWTLIKFGMGATSVIRANECRAAPSARARETGRASARAIGLLTPPCTRRRRDYRKRKTSGDWVDQSGVCRATTRQRKYDGRQLELEVYAACEASVHKAHKPPQR